MAAANWDRIQFVMRNFLKVAQNHLELLQIKAIPAVPPLLKLPTRAVQLPWQGFFSEIDRGVPQDAPLDIDSEASTAIAKEESQSISALVSADTPFAKRCNRPVSQQRRNFRRLEAQQRSKQCGIDKYVACAHLDLLRVIGQFKAPDASKSDQPGNHEHSDYDEHKPAGKHRQQRAFLLDILIAVLIEAAHVISPRVHPQCLPPTAPACSIDAAAR